MSKTAFESTVKKIIITIIILHKEDFKSKQLKLLCTPVPQMERRYFYESP